MQIKVIQSLIITQDMLPSIKWLQYYLKMIMRATSVSAITLCALVGKIRYYIVPWWLTMKKVSPDRHLLCYNQCLQKTLLQLSKQLTANRFIYLLTIKGKVLITVRITYIYFFLWFYDIFSLIITKPKLPHHKFDKTKFSGLISELLGNKKSYLLFTW